MKASREIKATLMVLSIFTLLSKTHGVKTKAVNSLIFSVNDRDYTNVEELNYNLMTDCVLHCAIQETKCLAIVYQTINKYCVIILASYKEGTNKANGSYFIDGVTDKIFKSAKYDEIVETVIPTVIQQRWYGNVTFDKTWSEYVQGFGDYPNGDFWIGLAKIPAQATHPSKRIRFEMWMHNGTKYIAEYNHFQLGYPSENYKLWIDQYDNAISTAGEKMSEHYAKEFSTKDNDNDASGGQCSHIKGYSGFWFNSCGGVNANGVFTNSREINNENGITWHTLDGFNTLHRFKMFVLKYRN